MNSDRAIFIGGFIQEAYQIQPGDLTPPAAGLRIKNYTVLSKIYGNDLATDFHTKTQIVSFGLLLQDDDGNVIVALRGTQGIWEWLHDAMFLLMPCPINGAIGFTEDGFSQIYKSLRIVPDVAGSLVLDIASYQFPRPVKSLTVCGHSLGGALATLLAFDLQVNTEFNVFVYTFASPRVGDPMFVANYNHVVQNSYRIANRADIVPKMPLPPLYEHVNQLADLNPIDPGSGQSLVNFTIPCEHSLTTYLYLLSRLPDATQKMNIEPSCASVKSPFPTGLIGLI